MSSHTRLFILSLIHGPPRDTKGIQRYSCNLDLDNMDIRYIIIATDIPMRSKFRRVYGNTSI